jgi:hypothetical protein
MNIYLIPYNWSRHVIMPMVVGAAGIVGWWISLVTIVAIGPVFHEWRIFWPQGFEGNVYVLLVASLIAGASVFAEGSIRRRKLVWRVGYAVFAASVTVGLLGMWVLLYWLIKPYLGSSSMRTVLSDPSLVTLRYRIAVWGMAGITSGLGPLAARWLQVLLGRWKWGQDPDASAPDTSYAAMGLQLLSHAGGGLAAGLLGAATWHTFGLYNQLAGDLYLAAAMAPLVWGMCHGALVWGVPDDLYAGWVRVLSAERYGLRIPVNHPTGGSSERFVGHFPRGLDLYLPAERGVAELHTSFVVSSDQAYSVRGLSVQPTVVKRFLEKIDLRYDVRRPAPLETGLKMEDRVLMGPNSETQLEFLLLPKEEQ